MSIAIAPRAAVDRLQGAGFLYRGDGTFDNLAFQEFERQDRGILQRVVLYAQPPRAVGSAGTLQYAVLRTKCSPRPGMFTVYDAEHLMCRGSDCVSTLLSMADAHWEQYATAGGTSFFSIDGSVEPHYDLRRPLEVFAA